MQLENKENQENSGKASVNADRSAPVLERSDEGNLANPATRA
jgi:hypothetical protein